jgi:hypothetical protein
VFTHSRTVGAGICVAMLASVHSYAADAAEWGQAVNGLRMSISIVPVEGGPANLLLVLQNTGDKDLTVGPLHFFGGHCDVFDYVNLFWKGGGVVWPVRPQRGGSVTFRPCTVALHPGEEFSFRENQRVFAALAQAGEFWIEYEPRADATKAGCRAVPCWAGKVVSNTLVIPQ